MNDAKKAPQAVRIALARQYLEWAMQNTEWAREHLDAQINDPDPQEPPHAAE